MKNFIVCIKWTEFIAVEKLMQSIYQDKDMAPKYQAILEHASQP